MALGGTASHVERQVSVYRHIKRAVFARQIGWTKTRLNELIRGKRGITAAAALDLAETLGTSPKLWMNHQASYDLDKAAAARRGA